MFCSCRCYSDTHLPLSLNRAYVASSSSKPLGSPLFYRCTMNLINLTTLKASNFAPHSGSMVTDTWAPTIDGVWSSFFGRGLHSRMPLDPTHVGFKQTFV
jgi:hypothetical protein